ncbi:hypothetical protein [Halobacteriovorax sp. HLS]|uniref:hypothetical protein n=1 Tax=Halobacteriovorax sp. HLS TaxID=2234000 RepID=UPI000FD79E71|nr:hypothetical protein [Halobacteriovorax sp. HLS]
MFKFAVVLFSILTVFNSFAFEPSDSEMKNIISELRRGESDFVLSLLSKGMNPNISVFHNIPLLHTALYSENGDSNLNRNYKKLANSLILNPRTDLSSANVDGDTPLFIVRNFERVKLLLENGANPHYVKVNTQYGISTTLLSTQTSYHIVRLLLDYKVAVTCDDYMSSYTTEIEKLLFEKLASSGVDPDSCW